jgi:hypothetical protein
MTVRRHAPLLVSLALALGASPAAAETLEKFMGEAFAGGLFHSEHIKDVRRGKVARIDSKPVDVRELAAAVACLVDEPSWDVLAPFVDVIRTIPGANLEEYTAIHAAETASAFAGVSLGPRAADELPRYRRFEEGIGVNLSADEVRTARGLSGTEELDTFVRSLARDRYSAYAREGLDGIKPYVRGPGWEADPRGEMLRDLNEIAYLPDLAPTLFDAWRDYPAGQKPDSRDGHFWIRADLDERPALILTHRLAMSEGAIDFVAIRHYYFSHFFDSGQAMAFVADVPEGRVLVYASRFWVDGWSGSPSLKQKIGTKMLAKKMQRLLDDLGVCGRSE